ncbi:hypothetical protein B0H19DRAFT_1382247 [Mycena capillaripes]|nr:hypothetical protein B0H19DRAFT_1382247 [Mycena capillaripes]
MSLPKPAVAIVGISAELPGGTELNLDHEGFFEFLLTKGEAYEDFPAEKFNIDAWQGSNLGQILPRKGSFLKNVAEFDYGEFGITAKDAYAMALSTRKLLEHSFLALLDSGIDSRGQDVGVYMAGTAFDTLSLGEQDVFEARGLLSGIPCMIANKVSYHLDLTGPSIPIDTACSSSLTALHLASQALRAGECRAALVGGSQLNHRFIDYVQYSQSSVLAPDGKCKPFDAAADGFSRGEGVVVVVLKLLDEAIRDGDHIYASILGTAVNATGSAAPLYAPVAESQRKAMEMAFGQTDCRPSEVDFVELHATGTAAGDPTEANWVGSAFGGNRELLVGSVKGNIGHLEITAFLASLSKVCSIFRTGLIPPTVNLLTPNPAIRWKEYNMQAPTEVTALPKRSGRSLISMTSSGIGGSNGHVIVEAPPPSPQNPSAAPQIQPVLLVAGGLSPQTASAVATTLATFDATDLRDLSTIYGRRSRQLTWRTFATWIPGQERIEFPPPTLSPKVKAPIVFVFSGQGPQHFNMGRQLFENFEAFRTSVLRMDKVYRLSTGQSLVNDFGLFDNVAPKRILPDIWPIEITQPALMILQMALYDLFVANGVFPDLLVAHSAGETAMLYASGAISQEMAVEIAIARGLAMRSVEEFGGAMAAVGCTVEQAARNILLTRGSDVLEIGCLNGPDAVALSGSEAAIDRAVEHAQSQGFFARKIKTRVAVHSSLMERCREDYQAQMADIYSRYPGQHIPSKTTYSSQTGLRWVAPFTADYMWTNTRNPVYFTQAISTLLKDHPNAIFMEISPHPVLTSYIASIGVKQDFIIAPLRRKLRPEPFAEVVSFLGALGALSCLGSNRVDFRALNGPTALKSTALPPYPFNRKTVAYCSPAYQSAINRSHHCGPLNYKGMALNMLTHTDLAQHVIKGEPILPATAYLEMAFEFGASHLWNVEFISMLPLLKDKVLRVEVTADQHHWEVRSWSAEQSQITPRLHACGYMAREIPSAPSTPLDIKEIQARCVPLPVKRFYDSIVYFAQYGPAFRQIRKIWTGDNEALVEINNAFHSSDSRYIVNPAILDSCLHVLVHPAFTGDANQSTYYLPSGVQEVILHTNGKMPATLYSYSTFRDWYPEQLIFDIVVVDSMGNKICSLLGAKIAKHGGQPDEYTRHYDIKYQPMSSSCFTSPRQLPQSPEYMFLDSVVITSEPSSASFHLLDSVKTLQATPAQILDEIIYPAESSIAQVREVLDHLISQGKTVISLLEIGNVSGSLSRLLRALPEQYSDISLSIVTSGVITPELDICFGLPSISFDPDQNLKGQGLSPWSYDIVVGIHALGFVEDRPLALRSLHDLLIPGGFLVLSESSEDPSLCYGRKYHRFDWATWTKDLRDCGFNIVSGPTNDAELLVVLGAQRDALHVCAHVESSTLSTAKHLHVVSFPTPHHALELRQILSHLEGSTEEQTLWIEATDETLEGSAARGFSRSLRREGLKTDIRLVLFDASWKPDHRNAIIRYLSEFPHLEKEVVVDVHAGISVPRVVRQPLVIDPSATDLSEYWKYHAPTTSLIHSSIGSPRENEVLVQVLSASRIGPLTGIVGVVHATRSSLWAVGARIIGVSASDLSNMQIFFEGEIAELPADVNVHAMSTLVIPLLILAFALGSYLVGPCRLVGQRVHIAEDDSLAKCIHYLWGVLNLESSSLRNVPSSFESLSTSTIVIAGRLDSAAMQVLKSRIQSSTSVFVWDDPISGIHPRLQKERWLAGDILQKYVPAISMSQPSLPYLVTGKDPREHIPPTCSISNPVQLDSNRVYLLLGGIGSFGIHVAIWMYTRGARWIILTSRTGAKSLNSPDKQALKRALGYLAARPDLELRLEACDCTSEEEMRTLLKSIHQPLAGCVLLSAVLVDGLFTSFDLARSIDYKTPITSKIDAFQAVEKVIAIEKLDFFISTTSVMTFGSAGQTNYSSANTALEWLTGRYPNAFSLVAPGITDSTFAFSPLTSLEQRTPIWLKYAMSSQELCKCIENGLKRLRTGPFRSYIPDLDWDVVQEHLGPSPLYHHLLAPSAATTLLSDDRHTVEKIILDELHLDEGELDPTVPLTSYGLDSLSASRLSSALKPFTTVTQLQLLADVTLQDIQRRLTESAQEAVANVVEENGTEEKPFDWKVVNQQGESLIKLVIGRADDIPLIIVHGSTGNPIPFQPLQHSFTSALWAFQFTPDTPFSSFSDLATFYLALIKEARPNGPYRLAVFSASCPIGLELVRRLEASGDTVLQLAFIDHFPLLFASPILVHDLLTETFGKTQQESAIRQLYSLMLHDPHENWTTRDPLNFEAAQMRIMVEKTGSMMVPYAMALSGKAATEEEREVVLQHALGAAIDEIKAHITVYIAGRGILRLLQEACPSGEWDDYGISYCGKHIDAVVFEDEGHLSLFHSKTFSDSLENSWKAQIS